MLNRAERIKQAVLNDIKNWTASDFESLDNIDLEWYQDKVDEAMEEEEKEKLEAEFKRFVGGNNE